MKLAQPERGARVRANLRLWRRTLAWLFCAWCAATIVVLAGLFVYAQKNGLSQRRADRLAAGAGRVMAGVLIAGSLAVLVRADRHGATR